MIVKTAIAAAMAAGVACATAGAAWPVSRPDAAVSALACSTGGKLTFHKGPVHGDESVYLIFWGSWWKSHGGTARHELENLFMGLGAKGWATTVTQYCDFAGPPQWAGSNLLFGGTAAKGSVIDGRNPPAAPTDAQLAAEAVKWAPRQIQNEFLVIPVVITPPGSVPAVDKANGYCGHHTYNTYSPSPGDTVYFPWIDLPYGFISGTNGCGWGQGVAGALSIAAGHEWAETVTDPFDRNVKFPGPAWYADSSGKEVGDLCEPGRILHFIRTNVFTLKLTTGSFRMQYLWSNAAGKCVKSS